MKNLMLSFLMCVITLILAMSASAYTLEFQNWGFDVNGTGTGGLISPVDEMTLLGITLNNSVPLDYNNPASGGTFTALSTLQVENFQNDNIVIGGTGVNNSYQITLVMNTTGSYVRNTSGLNELTFLTGTLNMYLDANLNYGSTVGLFGANDGTLIASFDLMNGSGLMDYRIANPDGRTNIEFGATYLIPGYWFDPSGSDMSLSGDVPLIVGLTDSNNQVIRNASTTAKTELTSTGLIWTVQGDLDNYTTFLSTNGSFAPAPTTTIPEPTTLMLIGFGLIGISGLSRNKIKMN